MSTSPAPRVVVLAPSPVLTVVLEASRDGDDAELHVHPGGQGVWIAQMAAELGADVRLCAAFGGETGQVIRHLMEERITTRAVHTPGENGGYVHDRRGGQRVEIGRMAASPLSRHAADELHGATLAEALDAQVCVLGGAPDGELSAGAYGRLAADLASTGCRVVADLAGPWLDAVAAAGPCLLKVSHEELLRDGRATDDRVATILGAIASLRSRGVQHVVVSRAERPAVAVIDGCGVEVRVPKLNARDPRGAGDSFTAGLAVAIARGDDVASGLRLGAAAGALNVTRRGLGTGTRQDIERLARLVELHELGPKGEGACER